MRDGVKLFTSVYVPKDAFTDNRTYPILMLRTAYGVRPYGLEDYRANLGSSELFAREKFIFVYQDVRGRFMSEGHYEIIRAIKDGALRRYWVPEAERRGYIVVSPAAPTDQLFFESSDRVFPEFLDMILRDTIL
jgi:hypothetical protein